MDKNGPVIQSLLDTDFHVFTEMQAIYHQFNSAEAEYRLICRTEGAKLAPLATEIQEEIEAFCALRFRAEELALLAKERVIKKDFLDFLEIYQARFKHVTVKESAAIPGGLEITVKGPWVYIRPFTIPILQIVSEVYFKKTTKVEDRMAKARDTLIDKISAARRQPHFDEFRFYDFGGRRRFSREWHGKVINLLKGVMAIQMVGSTNFLLAHKYGLKPIGSMSHEFLQACQVLAPKLSDFQKFAFHKWDEEYVGDLGVVPTDTISMDAFLPSFNMRYAKLFDGIRNDSGEPMPWAEKAIEHYKSLDINPMTKQLEFSNKMSFPMAQKIQERMHGRAGAMFGIGSYLTNDTGVPPLDITMKMLRCNGQPVAKISDTPEKSYCIDAKFFEELKKTFS